MKKNNFKLAALALSGAMALFSCGTTEEVKPNSSKPTVTIAYSEADYGKLGNKPFSADVSTQGDTAFIILTVNGSQETDAIYITYQKDNDVAGPWKAQPDGSSLKSVGASSFDGSVTNKKFDLASNLNSFTYDINNDVNKAFKVTIPVILRKTSTAKSDVFTIWITKPGNARFDNPAKNLAYGVAVVTFNYTNEKLVNNYATVLGNATNADFGSVFSTSTGSNYKRSDANNATTGPTIDFLYNTPGTAYVFGSAATDANGTIESANATNSVTAGFDVNGADDILGNSDDGFYYIKNYTKFAKVDKGSFATITGESSLATFVNAKLGSSTDSKLVYTTAPVGEEFVFKTASGKLGIVKIVTASGSGVGNGSTSGEAELQVKVQRD